MPDFNPSPGPPNDPNYTRDSRATSEPMANRSSAIALDTAGGALSGGAKAFDEAMKQGIQDKIYAKVDPERDKFTSALETLNTQLKGQSTAATANTGVVAPPVRTSDGSSTGGKSLLDANASMDAPEDNLPVGLQDGLDRFTSLTLAKQSGAIKLNDTDYAGQVLGVAKQLRTQYPGYREYIDEQTSKASGLPVANSYYQNLLLDVNRQLAGQKQNKDDFGKMLEWGVKEGVPHLDTYISQRQNGDPKYPGDAAVLGRINDWTTYKANLGIQEKQRSEADWNQKQGVDNATKNITNNATSFVQHQINDNIALSGMPTLKSLTTYFDDAAAGRIKTTDQEVQQRALQLQAYHSYIVNSIRTDNSKDATTIGSKAAEDIVKTAMAPIQTYIDLVNQKDGPLANFHLQQAAHIQSDDEYSWLTSKDVGPIGRSMLTARKIYGDQYFPTWVAGLLKTGMDEPLAQRFSQEAVNAVSPVTDNRGQPVQRYMKDAVTDAKKAGNDGKGVPDPNFYGHVTGLITGITDPAMPQAQKDALINWTFNPKNQGILNEFRQDYRDPSTGNWVAGKEAAFVRMSAPLLSGAIAESAKSKPENYSMYLNWQRSEFGNAYREDLQQLNNYKFYGKTYDQQPTLPGAPASGGKLQSEFHMAWNNNTHQAILVDNKNVPVEGDRRERLLADQVKYPDARGFFDKLDTVNRGIAGLNTAYMYSPVAPGKLDVDGYLLQTIKPFLSQENRKNFTADMSRSIIKANKPEMSMKDIDQMLFGTSP